MTWKADNLDGRADQLRRIYWGTAWLTPGGNPSDPGSWENVPERCKDGWRAVAAATEK